MKSVTVATKNNFNAIVISIPVIMRLWDEQTEGILHRLLIWDSPYWKPRGDVTPTDPLNSKQQGSFLFLPFFLFFFAEWAYLSILWTFPHPTISFVIFWNTFYAQYVSEAEIKMYFKPQWPMFLEWFVKKQTKKYIWIVSLSHLKLSFKVCEKKNDFF